MTLDDMIGLKNNYNATLENNFKKSIYQFNYFIIN